MEPAEHQRVTVRRNDVSFISREMKREKGRREVLGLIASSKDGVF